MDISTAILLVILSQTYSALAIDDESGVPSGGSCAPFHFGEDCSSRCNCRKDSEQCDVITGACAESGCYWGYTGANCSIKLAQLTSVPTSSWQTSQALGISFKQWDSSMLGVGPVLQYRLIYRKAEEREWTYVSTTYPHNGLDTDITVGGLEPGTLYIFVVECIVDPNLDGGPSPEGSARTKTNSTSLDGNHAVDGQLQTEIDKGETLTIVVGVLGGSLAVCVIALVAMAIYCTRKNKSVSKTTPPSRQSVNNGGLGNSDSVYEEPLPVPARHNPEAGYTHLFGNRS